MLSCQAVDCELNTIGESKHCEYHISQFKPLYLKYKRLHIHIKDKLRVPLETYNVYELLKLSSSLEELYQLRSDYRKFAFRPEYHDIGHSRILHEVLHKLDEVRSLLTSMFMKASLPDISNDNTSTEVSLKEEESIASQESITFVNNIRASVVAKHKEEWDKQSQIDYEYNIQLEAKLKFVIGSSIVLLQKMKLSNPKRTFELMFIIFALRDYLITNKASQQLIGVVFLEDLHKHIDKYKLTFKLSSEVYKSLITKEPSCLMVCLSNLPSYKPRAIATCLLNNSTIMSLHKDNDEKYVCPFKLTETSWDHIDQMDIMYTDKIYETFTMLRSSMQGLSISQKLKKIRDIKHKAISNNGKKHK